MHTTRLIHFLVRQEQQLIRGKAPSSQGVNAWICLFLSMCGCAYMMVNNALYGIAGHIAVIGMCLGVWPGIILLLGRKNETIAQGDNEYTEEEEEVITIPNWQYIVLQSFFGLLYLFAGMSKMDHDWRSGLTVVELFRLWTGPTVSSALRQSVLQVSNDGS